MLVPSTTEHETDQGVPSREGQAPQALGWVGRCGRPTPAACATTVAPAATPPMEFQGSFSCRTTAPHSMKTPSPLGQGGTSGGF